MDKRIKRRIGVLGILGMFMAIILAQPAVAADIPMNDGDWIGFSSSTGRIEFDDQTPDEIEILDANVGINNQDPAARLEITDTTNTELRLSDSVSSYTDIANVGSGYLYINPSFHRVGIGISSPTATLEVNPTIVTTPDYTGIKSGMTFNPGIGTMTNWWGVYVEAPFISTGSITNKYALVTESDAGNVGIGTTTPDDKLEIEWDTNVDAEFGRGTTDTDITFLTLRNAVGTKCYIYPDVAGTGIVVTTTHP